MLRQTDLELKVILLLFPAITGFAKRLRQLKAKMNSRVMPSEVLFFHSLSN